MLCIQHIAIGALASLASVASAQYFRRTSACPTFGCIFPPDQTDFAPGQLFDIRVEVQSPINGSQVYNGGIVNNDFTLQIGIDGVQDAKSVADFFPGQNLSMTRTNYTFSWYEDLFHRDNSSASRVNTTAVSWRSVALYSPGEYTATLYYNNGLKTVAHWTVSEACDKPIAKNAIFFIGDGMAPSMITAARLIGHKSINGKYQSKMKLDEAPGFGQQMTHSIDSFITDSANSATALYSGKKGTVNALNAYTDSSSNIYANPKYETMFEMARRINNAKIGVVTTAYSYDATPAATSAHTSSRNAYDLIVKQYLQGVTANYSGWTQWDGPDVHFGGGAELWSPRIGNGNVSQYDLWQKAGYQLALNKTSLEQLDNSQRALGLFAEGVGIQGNLSTWLDRNVYIDALKSSIKPGRGGAANDQPGLKDMTLKALDILNTRSQNDGDTGFFMMAEAALIDKEMHVLDYDRALGELLELDDTVRATLQKLEDMGIADETLVVVTADHGHGFDVFGSADTVYLAAQSGDRKKRDAIGTYQNSGLSGYQVEGRMTNPSENFTVPPQTGFPVTWDPRYAFAAGFSANPDHREDYAVHSHHEREPANTVSSNSSSNYYVNPEDATDGFIVNGTIPISNDQGVHSLTDVSVYAWGERIRLYPGHELYRGHMNSPDIFFHFVKALGLARTEPTGKYGPKKSS